MLTFEIRYPDIISTRPYCLFILLAVYTHELENQATLYTVKHFCVLYEHVMYCYVSMYSSMHLHILCNLICGSVEGSFGGIGIPLEEAKLRNDSHI